MLLVKANNSSSNCFDAVCEETVPQSKLYEYIYYKCVSICDKGWQLLM